MGKNSERMKWISVKKALPKTYEDVIVYVYYDGHESGTISDCYIDEEGVWILGSAKNFRLTHWMKYPLKPRGSR